MEKIDVSKLKRNAKLIKSKYRKVGDMLIAKEKLYILFPSKFVDKDLSILDNVCKILGVIAIMDDNNNYAVSTIPGRIDIEPSEIETVDINNELYTMLVIEPGDPLFSDTRIIQNTDMVFNVFELLLLQGKVPFYLNYEDLLNVFTNMPRYTGTSVGKDSLVFEILIALSARNPNNLDQQFRMFVKDRKMAMSITPAWVGLRNIYYSYNSTLSKIAGSYFKKGLVASIIKPEKDATVLENILRK